MARSTAVFALFLIASIAGATQAVDYTVKSSYYEGTRMDIWEFGVATAKQTTISQVYHPIYVDPDTVVPDSGDGGSYGEIQPLLCNGTSCPNVHASETSNIFAYYQAMIPDVGPDSDNSTFTSTSTFNTSVYYGMGPAAGSYTLHKFVEANDRLLRGAGLSTPPTQGWYDNTEVWVFNFGSDNGQAGEIYEIQGGNSIFRSVGSHFAKKYVIIPPADATIQPTRFSEIPAAWIAAESTSTDNQIYLYGFSAVGRTPPTGGASSLAISGVVIAAVALIAALF